MINKRRMTECFKKLVGIDSVSGEESAVCAELRNIFDQLGAATRVDDAGKKADSNSGNLIARFAGNVAARPLLLSAHMDTVGPGRGIVVKEEDGVISSAGDTVLGADDKSGIAVIIEVLNCLLENNLPFGPLELVFTICEETGMKGAKNLDYGDITADFGYVLDSVNTEKIITRAPASNKIEILLHGKSAHAAFAPEKGINAISLASKAIASLNLGRIDTETTCNIGVIEGGVATNIVPERVRVRGEVRSHSMEKLKKITDEMVSAFNTVVEEYKNDATDSELPRMEVTANLEYPRTKVPDDHSMVSLAREAAKRLGRELETEISCGGADANIFFSKNIMTGVLGTGMQDVHTTNEHIRIDDMVRSAELVLEIIRLHAERG